MAAVRNARMKSLLTSREREVFELLVQDKTTRDIAEALFISEKTVRNHISNVMWPAVRGRQRRSPRRRNAFMVGRDPGAGCDIRHAAPVLLRLY